MRPSSHHTVLAESQRACSSWVREAGAGAVGEIILILGTGLHPTNPPLLLLVSPRPPCLPSTAGEAAVGRSHRTCTNSAPSLQPAAAEGHKEKVKWRVLCLQISKSHESERSCTILDLGGQGRHKHDDPAQLHNIFIQGCWNTLGMYCISSCGNMRFMQIMRIFANMRMRLKISSTLTTYYLPKIVIFWANYG